jgi:hypothetical protein
MHGPLEEGRGVGEVEVHHSQYIGPLWGFECRFVLVFFGDTDVVIAPSDVKL